MCPQSQNQLCFSPALSYTHICFLVCHCLYLVSCQLLPDCCVSTTYSHVKCPGSNRLLRPSYPPVQNPGRTMMMRTTISPKSSLPCLPRRKRQEWTMVVKMLDHLQHKVSEWSRPKDGGRAGHVIWVCARTKYSHPVMLLNQIWAIITRPHLLSTDSIIAVLPLH